MKPSTLSTVPLGALVELVDGASYGGTMYPRWLARGTVAKVTGQLGTGTFVRLRDPHGEPPPLLVPSKTACRVLEEPRRQAKETGGEVDPLAASLADAPLWNGQGHELGRHANLSRVEKPDPGAVDRVGRDARLDTKGAK